MKKSPSLIINSPYAEPSQYWALAEEAQSEETQSLTQSLALRQGRRQAGYMIADPTARPHQHRGIFVELPLVNQIRKRVGSWRSSGYPGITGITKRLLEHWQNDRQNDRQNDEQRDFPFFFCQIEAIETLIWLIEAPVAEKSGIDIPSDGGAFRRLCSKLATGTGKTVVMAMLIAWQAINRATYPKDGRFSKNIFIVAPNLTVKERLAVLRPENPKNYYDEFGVVPISLREKLRQAKILIRNWHALHWETDEKIKKKKGVDRRGAKSNKAYLRDALGDMASARNLIVINDEAHHAWRVPARKLAGETRGVSQEEIEEATQWVGGLDRIDRTLGILNCFDFSATPFAPGSRQTAEEALFGWIVSDFGLNDAIESGLVKTPRVVVRDSSLPNTKAYKSRFYHIYTDPEVKDDLNRRAEPHEPLPDLINTAYALLGADWDKTRKEWSNRETNRETPPVMITVANRTETAARIKYAFESQAIPIEPLCDPEGILHIDSKALKKAEQEESETATQNSDPGKKLTQQQQAENLREQVNTVGQIGRPGEKIQNVISVGMLSEGWDARTVTHIMGLRAFTSQLLCEQVIGRGLRRASYEINEATGLFDAEYVNVFGVPFSFLPHEESAETPLPPLLKITVQPVAEKRQFAIEWPNVLRIERIYRPELSVDWSQVDTLHIDASKTADIAEIAPTVNNQPDLSKIEEIDLEKLMRKQRRQTAIFRAAQSVYREQKPNWKASPTLLMAQLVKLAEQFMALNRIQITPHFFGNDEKKRELAITLNMSKVIQHFWQVIRFSNTEKTTIVLDSDHPIRSTSDMRPWRTGKPCEYTKRSHINYCVYDSAWEASDAFALDRHGAVRAWAKNDHLGFSVLYVYNGVVRRYYPDFIAQLQSGEFLALETKGQETNQDRAKWAEMKDWVEAVNEHGGFGKWHWGATHKPGEIESLLDRLPLSSN